MKVTFWNFIIFFLIACQSKPRNIEVFRTGEFVESRLGSSTYYVMHPNSMLPSENRDKEGRLSYIFGKLDSLPPYSNTFSIGLNHGGVEHFIGYDLPVIEQVQSTVLGQKIDWMVRKSDTGYFVVNARLKDLKFYGTSSTKTGIDSMVALISTLSFR